MIPVLWSVPADKLAKVSEAAHMIRAKSECITCWFLSYSTQGPSWTTSHEVKIKVWSFLTVAELAALHVYCPVNISFLSLIARAILIGVFTYVAFYLVSHVPFRLGYQPMRALQLRIVPNGLVTKSRSLCKLALLTEFAPCRWSGFAASPSVQDRKFFGLA